MVEPDPNTDDNTGVVDFTRDNNNEPIIDDEGSAANAAHICNNEVSTVDTIPTQGNKTADNVTSRIVSWTDRSKNNMITTGCRQHHPNKRDATEGYHFANINEDIAC